MKKNIQKDIKTNLKKFWNYLWHDDSIGSYILNFLVAFIVIKYIFFPVVGFALGNDYPVVAIVSGSMEHKVSSHTICNVHIADIRSKNLDFDGWWSYCGKYYEKFYNMTKSEFETFEYKNGLNIGDVMVLYGKDPENIEIGEVLIFKPLDEEFFATKGPVIHRVVNKWEENGTIYFRTKGDHNPQSFTNFEERIPEENVIGVSILRIPFLGYAKLMLNRAIEGMGNI